MNRRKFILQFFLFLGIAAIPSPEAKAGLLTWLFFSLDPILKGLWMGAATSSGMTLKMIVKDKYLPATLVLARDKDFSEVVETRAVEANTLSEMIALRFNNLGPDSKYFFKVIPSPKAKSKKVSKTGSFTTFPRGEASFRFAFGTCAATGSNSKVFHEIQKQNPLFFINAGDLHYANIEKNDPDAYRKVYKKVLGPARQADLYRNVPIAYIWDDHDFGGNNSCRTNPGREAARRVYQEYVPHYPLVEGQGNVAIYQAFTVGRVRFIITDLRSEKSPAEGPEAPEMRTIMGEKQKKWFKEEVARASREFALVVWVNSTPWIGAAEGLGDRWFNYSHERKELANHFKANGVNNLMIVSGDAHMLAIDDGTNSDYADGGGAPITVFHAAPLCQTTSVKGGPYSLGISKRIGQFGVVDIEDNGADGMTVRLTGRHRSGDVVMTHQFSV